MQFHTSAVLATPQPTAELERLGDEIAELSAHPTPPPRGSSPSSASSTPKADGIRDSAPRPSGSAGEWGWTSARPASACGWRELRDAPRPLRP
jgi:hypothetical protein